MDGGEAGESAGGAEGPHGECGAWVGFSGGGDAVVAGDVVEVVAGDEEFGDGLAGGELGGGVDLPVGGAAAVAVGGAEGGVAGLLASPLDVFVAGVRQLDADGAAVQAAELTTGFGIGPFTDTGVAGSAVEWAALVDGAIAIDDEVGGCAFGSRGLPEVDAGGGGCAGREVDDEASADRHGGTAGEGAVADLGTGQPVEFVNRDHLELSGRMRRHGVEMATVALPP